MDSAQPRTSSDDTRNSSHEQISDPAEDPFSSGVMLETGSSFFGAVIAILSLIVPIGGVMADRLSFTGPSVAENPPALIHGHQQPGTLPRTWAGAPAGGDPRR
jgi:hypothetical protein